MFGSEAARRATLWPALLRGFAVGNPGDEVAPASGAERTIGGAGIERHAIAPSAGTSYV